MGGEAALQRNASLACGLSHRDVWAEGGIGLQVAYPPGEYVVE